MTNTGFNKASFFAQGAESLEVQGMFAKISGSREPEAGLNMALTNQNDQDMNFTPV